MAVSFVAILPISVMFAATKDRLWGPSVWFQTHRALNVSISNPLGCTLRLSYPSTFVQHSAEVTLQSVLASRIGIHHFSHAVAYCSLCS